MESNSKFIWIKNGNTFSQVENNMEVLDSELPRGVYKPVITMAGCKLLCIDDEFKFSFKVYNLEGQFIQHVLKTWNSTDKNLGVLLNGTKGSGKTQTGKLLANATGLPIVLIDNDDREILEFIKGFDFPCVLFFDEYEKIFEESGDILTLMDGMYSDLNRKLFILTTNEKRVNSNLLSRPSRIRYFREFNNISLDLMVSYIKDNLQDQERLEEIITFIDKLEISTIDIVKAIVEELNLHNCTTEEVLEYMNLSKRDIRCMCVYSYNSKIYKDLEAFKADVHKLYKPGKDRKGNNSEYLLPSNLSLNESRFKFYKLPCELKVGDSFNDDWEITRIEQDEEERESYFIEAKRYDEDVMFLQTSPYTTSSSIYGNDLLKYTL